MRGRLDGWVRQPGVRQDVLHHCRWCCHHGESVCRRVPGCCRQGGLEPLGDCLVGSVGPAVWGLQALERRLGGRRLLGEPVRRDDLERPLPDVLERRAGRACHQPLDVWVVVCRRVQAAALAGRDFLLAWVRQAWRGHRAALELLDVGRCPGLVWKRSADSEVWHRQRPDVRMRRDVVPVALGRVVPAPGLRRPQGHWVVPVVPLVWLALAWRLQGARELACCWPLPVALQPPSPGPPQDVAAET